MSKVLPMLTKMCTAPKRSIVLATAFLQDSSLLTSAWMISETPPSSSIIRFVSLAQSTLKSIRATLAPCLASRMAAARPFPISPVKNQRKRTSKQGSKSQKETPNSPSIRDPAPVTMATSPVKSSAREGVMIGMMSTAHQNKLQIFWFPEKSSKGLSMSN